MTETTRLLQDLVSRPSINPMGRPMQGPEIYEHRVTAYLEDGLSPEDRARFDAHVEVCPGCRTYLAQIRRTIELSGGLTPEQLEVLAAELREKMIRTVHKTGGLHRGRFL